MMVGKLLPGNEQFVAPFFSNEYDGCPLRLFINRIQDTEQRPFPSLRCAETLMKRPASIGAGSRQNRF